MDEEIYAPDGPIAGNEAERLKWDAVEVMRLRAAEARTQRDASIGELRESMTDEEALDEFGIDLREIEK